MSEVLGGGMQVFDQYLGQLDPSFTLRSKIGVSAVIDFH